MDFKSSSSFLPTTLTPRNICQDQMRRNDTTAPYQLFLGPKGLHSSSFFHTLQRKEPGQVSTALTHKSQQRSQSKDPLTLAQPRLSPRSSCQGPSEATLPLRNPRLDLLVLDIDLAHGGQDKGPGTVVLPERLASGPRTRDEDASSFGTLNAALSILDRLFWRWNCTR